MVGQSSNNRIHIHVNKNYFTIDHLLIYRYVYAGSAATVFRLGGDAATGTLLKYQYRDSLLLPELY